MPRLNLFVFACTFLGFNCAKAVADQESAHNTVNALAIRQVKNGSSIVPIEKDGEDLWYGYFTVGSNKHQRLNIAAGSPFPSFHPDDYSPSPRSKQQGRPEVTLNGHSTIIHTTFYSDVIAIPGFSVPDAIIAVITKIIPTGAIHWTYGSTPLAGMAGGWFRMLCNTGLSQCRYGIAMGTNKKGKLIFGTLEESSLQGELTKVRVWPGQWIIPGDVIVQNKVYSIRASIYVECERNYILGPASEVREIFKQLGITELPNSTDKRLRGYHPCDKPPTFGFQFPSVHSPNGSNAKIFNVVPSAMSKEHIGNMCISALQGHMFEENLEGENGWTLGSPFFEGHYVDYNVEDKTIGFADLKDQGSKMQDDYKSNGSAMLKGVPVLKTMIVVLALMVLLIVG